MKKLSLGFTLIEILIALTIFSVMAGITSSVLYSVFNARERTTDHAIQLSNMQLAFVIIERDLTQIIFNPIKTYQGKETSVLGLENEIRFSRGGNPNPLSEKKQSSLVRIHYLLKDNQLIRESEPAISRDIIIQPSQQILLKDINHLTFEFINENQMAQTQWYQKKIPYAIRISINSSYWGKLSQIFMLNQSRQYYANR
jgi:general secretion pathway protein J